MQVKKSVCRKTGTKKLFAVGAAYKRMLASENFPPLPAPSKTIMVRPLVSLAKANSRKIWGSLF